MRVVFVPFLALLLLAGLGPICAMADDEAAAAPPSKEMKAPMRVRPHDKRPDRGPIVSAPMVGGKEDVTGSNDEHLSEVSEVRGGRRV